MPRWYHVGPQGLDANYIGKRDGIDAEDAKAIADRVAKHNPLTKPHRDTMVMVDGEAHIKVPGMYCAMDVNGNPIPRTVKYEAGSVAFGLLGYGYWVVPPNGYVDLDVSVPEKAVRDAAPHLISEAEYAAMKPKADEAEPAKARKGEAKPDAK